MKRKISRTPPTGAPEGTTWLGGPVDRFKVSLRISGDELDPNAITSLLGCSPTTAEIKDHPLPGGARISQTGRWSLRISSDECGEGDLEDGIRLLLDRLTNDLDVWKTLTDDYSVDLFCGLFLTAKNRGFELSQELSKLLSDRHLPIGFDIYFDPPKSLS